MGYGSGRLEEVFVHALERESLFLLDADVVQDHQLCKTYAVDEH
jgi:hypothetical protein